MAWTANGYVKRTATEIKDSLATRLQNDYPLFRQWSADIQNNLLDTGTVLLLEQENLFADLANSYAPGLSNDFIWEQQAASLGLQYKQATQSSVVLQFSGNTGAYVPPQTEVTGGFKTATGAIINESGFANVTAYSDTTSVYAANTINQIITLIGSDITGVTNPSASILGSETETNASLKARSQASLRNPRSGTIDYATSQLLQVNGVTDRLLTFNFTTSQTNTGIEAIVGGGENSEIASALLRSFLGLANLISEPSNNETARTNTWKVKYYGSEIDVLWTTPKALKLNIQITAKFSYTSVYKGNLETLLKASFANYLNNLRVGTPINRFAFDKLFFEACKEYQVDANYISALSYTIKDAADLTGSTTLGWDVNGYLDAVKKDVYVELDELLLEITT